MSDQKSQTLHHVASLEGPALKFEDIPEKLEFRRHTSNCGTTSNPIIDERLKCSSFPSSEQVIVTSDEYLNGANTKPNEESNAAINNGNQDSDIVDPTNSLRMFREFLK